MASKKSRRRGFRPFVRPSVSAEGLGRGAGPAARLAARAGDGTGGAVSAWTERASVDVLEARKLLFSLTIGPGDVDPATGLGTKYGEFGYIIPYLFKELPDEVDPETLVEEFEDEQDPWATIFPSVPPSGTFFEGSDIQVSYSATGAQLTLEPFPQAPGGTQPGDPQGDRDLRVRLTENGFVTFTFFEGVQENAPRPRLTQRASFTIGQSFLAGAGFPNDGTGLDTSATGTKVELLRGGQVVATFSGAALAALGTPTAGAAGDLRFDFNLVTGFEAVRFSSAQPPPDNAAYADSFRIDDIRVTFPSTRFATYLDDRKFGVAFSFTGPVGASVQMLDLNGRDIILTLAVGIPEGGNLPIVDPVGTGVPQFNDGIGRIIFTGTDARTTFTMIGGHILTEDGLFVFEAADGPAGLFDDFEQAGFGYTFSDQDPPETIGLPPAGGSVIIGSPYVRDNSTPENYLAPLLPNPPAEQFRRADQGVRVLNGASIGSVQIHGVIHGSSNFSGAVGRYAVGLLLGSTTIQGDLGSLFVASEAGHWASDELTDNVTDPWVRVLNHFTVGRTVGQIHIAGRASMDITVVGDVNNPARPRISSFERFEQEVVYGVRPETEDGDRLTLRLTVNENGGARGDTAESEAIIFGDEYFRNDTLMGAEFIGGSTSGVQLSGDLGLQDPINTGEDASDVFAFAADGSSDVVVTAEFTTFGQGFGTALARIVDADGRVLATHQFFARQNSLTPLGDVRFSFRPDHADVYYLVLNTPRDNNFDTAMAYRVSMTGLAPTTLGMYRVGAGAGAETSSSNSVTVQAGSMGAFRVGTGIVGGDGTENDAAAIMNNDEEVDNLFNWRNTTLSVAGNLYGIVTGSDVANGAKAIIGGNMGSMITGLSGVVGTGPREGDLRSFDLTVGGTLGSLDVRGAIAWESDPPNPGPAGPVFIRTGSNGGRGDIREILVGSLVDPTVVGSNFTVRTSPGSIIDKFIVGITGGDADVFGDMLGTPRFTLGAGSDVRFVDFGLIQSPSDADAFQPLTAGQPVTFTDDSGARITIEIRGGSPFSTGQVRVLPINNSQGVAVGRIDVTLIGAAELVVSGTGPGVASIGRINITTTTPGSVLTINGTAQVDVYRIDHVAGPALALIQNVTPGGDIVAIDAQGVDRVEITQGNLGRTQGRNGFITGPLLGVVVGHQQATNAPLGILQGALNPLLASTDILIPVDATTAVDAADKHVEDIGAPFDAFLNGMVVRASDVSAVRVAGAVGDVILQGGSITNEVIANWDNLHTTPGAFDGIVGTIYATDINRVDVGDGLAAPGPSPFAAAGIFATDDIQSVVGRAGANAVIRGVIAAANTVPDVTNNGIVGINLVGGRYDGAQIGAGNLDFFWTSARFAGGPDANFATGNITAIRGTNADLFRSEIFAANLDRVELVGGAWDATSASVLGAAGVILADEFRNTTRLGEPIEVRLNELRVTQNLRQLATNGQAGDISDMLIDVQGSVTDFITARNTARLDLQVDGTIRDLLLVNDIRATSVTAGQLVRALANGDIRSSRFDVSGPILNITAGSNITSTHINSTGPDGRIDLIQSRFFITGEISSSGPIGTITSTEGDIIAKIETTDTDGTLNFLNAGRDLLVTLDIAADVNTVTAGRNIGSQGQGPGARAINVRGNLNTIEARGGQIYTDVTVGQAITGVVRNARVAALPGFDLVSTATIRAFGPIALVEINGDLDGSIISESGGIGTIRITDGSFRPGNQIIARDGGIDQVLIVGGHLMGDILSDQFINAVRLTPSANGFYGDIGVNPNLSQTVPFDGLRNQLPPDAVLLPVFQGPRIQAGTNIGVVEVQKGSMWESSISAGYSITHIFILGVALNDHITPGLGGSFITAGDTIDLVEIGGFAGGLIIAAGVKDLGADGRPGGTGANADTVQFGRINDIFLSGGAGAVSIVAGMNAGPDGLYGINRGPDGLWGTADDFNDDEVADGFSSIRRVEVRGGVQESQVMADNGIGFTSEGLVRGGPGLKQANPGRVIEFVPPSGLIPNGVPTPFTTPAGETGRITFTGPGQVYFEHVFDPEAGRTIGRLAVINSTLASRLIVDTDQNSLTDFKIISNDGASLGLGSFRGNMIGVSSFYFDGYVQRAEFGWLNTVGLIGAGNDVGELVFGPTVRGNVFANYVASIVVGGDFGNTGETGEAIMDVVGAGSIFVAGNHAGLITSERDLGSVRILGEMNRGQIRAGKSINDISVGAMVDSRISVRDDLKAVTVFGSVTDSSIYAGADLGFDGNFGGVGASADTVTDGHIGTVSIGGNFVRSDIAAGLSRGPDGFLGSGDDVADAGRSRIDQVIIAGQALGSIQGSQSYRIASTGTLGPVQAAGVPFRGAGNLAVTAVDTTGDPLQVKDLRVEFIAGSHVATMEFNQPITAGLLSSALRIAEVRAGGVEIVLAEGTDYTVFFDAAKNSAIITFSNTVTGRDLPVTAGLPGPGIYRFSLSSAVLRGHTQETRLDGNNDGFADPTGDDFSQDQIVGDAGDKLVDNRVTTGGVNIDFRAAADLNQVLDDNRFADGLPDVNREITLRGFLGDHPDHDVNVFGTGGDADLYRITLRAGQILRLGAIQGNAQFATVSLLTAAGAPVSGVGDPAISLPASLGDVDQFSFEQNILITVTGTYLILVTGTNVNVTDPNDIANDQPVAGASGDYRFTVEVFDDGDSGFAGDSDSGDGARVANAPTPIQFAGADGILGTADDLPFIAISGFVFTYSAGPDGRIGSPGDPAAAVDDIVSGGNGAGMFSQRTAGPDRLFGTADDDATVFVAASIGNGNNAGATAEIQPDVDVFHLNNRDPIVPGTVIRVTLELTEFGSNLGLSDEAFLSDLRGDVQFAIFETSGATGVGDALLVAAPSDVRPVGGQPARSVSNGATSYGYDANGDFFIQFVTRGRQGVAGDAPASYAVYVQGATRADYTLKITTQGAAAPTVTTQNVLVETRGGIIDWLEAGRGVTTTLAPFSSSVIGFTGTINGVPVDTYIVNNVVAGLNDIFTAANVRVIFSNDPGAFLGQNFSTVFVTGSNEPASFFNNGSFGAAQHSDPFNTDPNDDAVVFLPSLGILGNGPDQVGVDSLVKSLTAAIARRVGELVGLRTLDPSGVGNVMSSDSPTNTPVGPYRFSTANNRLSSGFDALVNTNFYLGRENSVNLLDRILADRF